MKRSWVPGTAIGLTLALGVLAGAQGDGLVGRYYESYIVEDGRIVFTDLVMSFCRIDADVQHWDQTQWYRWEPVIGWGNSYSVEWTGFIRIDQPGLYGFGTMSDDGSEVWIDGELVVANAEFQWYDWEDNITEGDPDDPAGEIDLSAGFHEITVRFFEGGSYDGIELWWLLPDSGQSVIPYAGTTFHGDPPTYDPATNWLRVPGDVLYTHAETCAGDADGNGIVNVDDLLDVLADFGGCDPGCPTCRADFDEDGDVDIDDLLAVLGAWGPCP